jgi:hypothetical protein
LAHDEVTGKRFWDEKDGVRADGSTDTGRMLDLRRASRRFSECSGIASAPIFGMEVSVFGQVKELGQLRCPCFALESDGDRLYVWYDAMIDDNESLWSPVDISGIANSDWVVVTGELRESDDSSGTFWAAGIEVIR